METSGSEATLASDQVAVPSVIEPTEDAVVESAETVEATDAAAEEPKVEDVTDKPLESQDDSAEAQVEVEEAEEEEVEEAEEEEVEEEEVESTKKVKKSKKDASSDFEDEEDVEEGTLVDPLIVDDAALDKSNIITSGRRTRGKVIDFRALVASDEEDDDEDDDE